jgi:hemerythrin superfamily protein
MNIYGLIKKDHRKVTRLLESLVQSSEQDDNKWKEILNQIRNELVPHSRAEEALFYNAIRNKSNGNTTVVHAYGEHAVAEAELRTLQAMKAIDVNWTTLAKKLQGDILHHIKEEEEKVFNEAKLLLTEEEAISIGKSFKELKPKIKAESLAETTLELVTNLLPPKFVESIKEGYAKIG